MKWSPTNTQWLRHLLALIAGSLVTLSLAPFNIWPLGIVSCAVLAWLLQPLTDTRNAAWLGWFFGIGLFGTGSSWVYVSIHLYGNASVVLAAFLTLLFSLGLALFTAITFAAYQHWIKNRGDHGLLAALAFAAVWCLGEWLRSWLLTGFPWLYLGYAHLDTVLAGWAPVTGVYGPGFITALSGYTLFACCQSPGRQRGVLLAITLSLWLGGALLKQLDWVQPAQRAPLKLAMIQANIPQQDKWLPQQYRPTLQLYREMSQPLWSQVDLVIWPEAAIPNYLQNAQGYLTAIANQARQQDSSLITGIPYRDPQQASSYYNAAVALGNGDGQYFKQRLVPFGEYVPLESLLRGLIDFFDLPMSAFSAGPARQAALLASDFRFAPFICYEVVYPDLVQQDLQQADFLLTISNDAWFGASIGPLQHLQMAQMRALENGRYMLRATGNGVSAIIDERGQILAQSAQFERQILQGEAQAMTGRTPFSHSGSWPLLCLSLFLCIFYRFQQRP